MPDKTPMLGNILSVDKDQPLQSLMDLTRELGPIIRMDMMGTPLVVVSGHDLVAELCDETRFDKAVRGSLAGCGRSVGMVCLRATRRNPIGPRRITSFCRPLAGRQ
jgi:cytochrome P450